jgi:hypothetical protein
MSRVDVHRTVSFVSIAVHLLLFVQVPAVAQCDQRDDFVDE